MHLRQIPKANLVERIAMCRNHFIGCFRKNKIANLYASNHEIIELLEKATNEYNIIFNISIFDHYLTINIINQ